MGGWTRRRRSSMALIMLSGEPRLVLNVQVTNVCVCLCSYPLATFFSQVVAVINMAGGWAGGCSADADWVSWR